MLTKIESLPDELKAVPQWVCWTATDKVPKNPHTGRNAKANDPSTWGTFEQAVKACDTFQFDGLGFEFANGYFGVDLDHCADNADFCDEFVDGLKSYNEFSRSGSGLHILCKGSLPPGARRRGNVEMYASGRYFICTGEVYNPSYTQVADCTEAIKPLHKKYLSEKKERQASAARAAISLCDTDVIDKASSCKTGGIFKMLYAGSWEGVYSSQSEADLAFCDHLAFWTGKNAAQMDRIFRSSGLYRKKWDEKRGESTYGALTIGKACAQCLDTYAPVEGQDDTELVYAVFRGGNVGIEDTGKRYDQTDTGNAHRLKDRYGEGIRYSYNRKKWLWWDEKMWAVDEEGRIKKYADTVIDDMKKAALREQDEEVQKAALKWAARTAGSRNKEAMIKECQHLDGIPVMQEDLDFQKDYLNCQNGIVNLRNGELIPHESSFMMTRITGCDYDTSGEEPGLWLSFLDDVTGRDKELIGYIQRCLGYSLTGSGVEQCAYFLYGLGNNGKSTFLNIVSEALGGYAASTQPETIMMKRFGNDGPLNELARLKGVRFLSVDEPTEGVRLNEGLVKQLTGGSKITCRFLFSEEFEYTPEFKIWLSTNHKPVIRGTDYGIWRRIKMIPFEVNISKEKIDKELPQKLRKELPKILAWIVRGCLEWRKHGLMEPDKVAQASQEYRNEMDIIAGFVSECLEIDYEYEERTPAKDLYQVYCRWAKANNEFEMSSKKFFTEIGKKLPEKGRSRVGIYYKNVKIIDDYSEVKSYNWGGKN